MAAKTQVHLVDDDAAIRDAVGSYLRNAGLVVKTYESGSEFLAQLDASTSGCVLLDLAMPELDGLDVQQKILHYPSKIPVIFLTAYGTVRDTVTAIKAGAFDFLEKPCAGEILLECVQEAIAYDRSMRDTLDAAEEINLNYLSLSPREREIMALIAKGRSSKQIALTLHISPRTVDAHRARLMAKMQASSLAELGAMAALSEQIPKFLS